MADTYTVKSGDNLWSIVERFKDEYNMSHFDLQKLLIELNNIKDPNFIVVGQVLKLSGEPEEPAKTPQAKVTIDVFGLQSNAERTLYLTWTFTKEHVESYQVNWYYDSGDGVWFIGSNSTVSADPEEKGGQSLYTAPTNAVKVKVKVKPISEQQTKNNQGTSYWEGLWSNEKVYDFTKAPPTTPNTPTVEIKKYSLTATVNGIDETTTSHIIFEVVKDNNPKVYTVSTDPVQSRTGVASWTCNIDAGGEYKVRAKGKKGSSESDWSAYSTPVGTIPSASSGITELKALSETSVHIAWGMVKNATGYDIEYATKKTYFDSSTEVRSMSVTNGYAEITGLTSGEEYFFRVRAKNALGESGWTGLQSIVIGKDPSAPTTWSSTTTVIVGEELNLYWAHNTEDGSSQTYAELELYINGTQTTHTIKNSEAEEEKDKTSVYAIDTSQYTEGTQIQWRVRTAGITKVYGDWSTQRTIDVYAPPTLTLNIIDGESNDISVVDSFPFYVYGLAGPNTQAPIGYHISVIAKDSYTTTDSQGNEKLVNAGDAVYSKYFDTSDSMLLALSADNIDLENNIQYAVVCTVSMNSGLTAEATRTFTVAWKDAIYEPNAEISINMEQYTASIMPYCVDADGNMVENVTLSVYRREFDGSFVELATDLDNTLHTTITDPHPALDYARYRIVAITKDTGAVSYCDLPGVPVGGKCAIIQWSERWTSYNAVNEDELEESTWSGSMLKLHYNLDVSDSNSPDKQFVQYAGRKHDVSYYGTHLGHGSTWQADIDKEDSETLYALRRLQNWMGDVYVREPSGSGYWASVTVSFNQKHKDLTIPVSLNITRVEGGI